MPESARHPMRWYTDWHQDLRSNGLRMSDEQMEAAARLSAVLLCGDQSAIQIFAAEIGRQRGAAVTALHDLVAIERDEHLHERALQTLCAYLPIPDDVHGLKRRAQRFFASLGRVRPMARHFAQISHLDSAVCKIMWHVEHSSLSPATPLSLLAAHIKRDEARHVSISRSYAAAMGLPKSTQQADAERIKAGLAHMLQPLADSFEMVGVDPDKLFQDLQRQPAK